MRLQNTNAEPAQGDRCKACSTNTDSPAIPSMAVSTSDRSFRASDDDSFLLVMKGLKIAMVCQSVNVVEAYFFSMTGLMKE